MRSPPCHTQAPDASSKHEDDAPPHRTFWFNKRTAFAQWEAPPSLSDRLAAALLEADPESSGALLSPTFFRASLGDWQLAHSWTKIKVEK